MVSTDFALEQFFRCLLKSLHGNLFFVLLVNKKFSGLLILMKLSYLFTFVDFSPTKVSVRRLEKKELSTILPFCCLRTFQGKRTKPLFFQSQNFPKSRYFALNSCYLVSALDHHLVEAKLSSTAEETQVFHFASRIRNRCAFWNSQA